MLTALNTACDRATRLAEDAAEGLEETHGDDEAELDIQDILDSDDEAPIIRFVNSILSQAIRERASDIHLEPFERELSVRFRVDGVLRGVVNPPKAGRGAAIISRIKVMAGRTSPKSAFLKMAESVSSERVETSTFEAHGAHQLR